MPAKEASLIMFPMLAHPLPWATASPPNSQDVYAIQQMLRDVLGQIAKVKTILDIRPAPTQGRLRHIEGKPTQLDNTLAWLNEMRYPAQLTSWINKSRTLARQAASALDMCFDAIEQLKFMPPGSPEFLRQLNVARQEVGIAYQTGERLRGACIELIKNLSRATPLGGTDRAQQIGDNRSTILRRFLHRSNPKVIDLAAERRRRLFPQYQTTEPRWMMELTGMQYRQVHDALLDAFPTVVDLKKMVLFQLSENLDAIAQGDNLSAIIFRLLLWANAQGRIKELLQGAVTANQGNQKLRATVEKLLHPPTSHPLQGDVSCRSSQPLTKNVSKMLQVVTMELQQLIEIQTILKIQPGPSPRRMQNISWAPRLRDQVFDILMQLSGYHPAHTDWIVAARNLARQACDELDRCHRAVTQLQYILPEPTYTEQLNEVRQSCDTSLRFCGDLQKHLDRIVSRENTGSLMRSRNRQI